VGFNMDRGNGPDADINVTPLIDIVLVMLIIFMVITPRTVEEMAANLPSQTKQQRPKPDEVPDQLLVAAYDNGEVALNLKVMERRELFDQLRRRLRAKEKKVVFVDAHPNLEYGKVVEVMDLVRDAGADRVGLARLKDEGPGRAPTAAPEGGEGAAGAEVPAPG
jgi:biopolymer transport protein ExbD